MSLSILKTPSYQPKRNEILLFDDSENVIIWWGWLEDRGNVKLLGKFLYLRKWGGSQHPSSDLVSELNNKVANLRNYRLIWLHRSCLQKKCHFCHPRPKSDHFLIDKLDQILGLNRSARLNGDIGLWTLDFMFCLFCIFCIFCISRPCLLHIIFRILLSSPSQ